MPRFANPHTAMKLWNLINQIDEVRSSVDQHEPIAGLNREVLRDSGAELTWALIYLHKAYRALTFWTPVGGNGSPSLEKRITNSRRGVKKSRAT